MYMMYHDIKLRKGWHANMLAFFIDEKMLIRLKSANLIESLIKKKCRKKQFFLLCHLCNIDDSAFFSR